MTMLSQYYVANLVIYSYVNSYVNYSTLLLFSHFTNNFI